jgi:hypothetical protein
MVGCSLRKGYFRPFQGRGTLLMQDATRWWQNRWEAGGWVLFAALTLAFCPLAISRTATPNTTGDAVNAGTDFWEFYRSAGHVWQEGARAVDSKFSHYLPSVDVAFGLLAWMPFRMAAVVWLLLMTAAWLCLLAAVRRDLLCDFDPAQARRSVLAAGLIVLPLFLDHLCVGAFHILMVWWMAAGLGRVSRGRSWSGGVLLGLAVWIKLLPLLGVGYLLLKRKWLPAAVALVTALLVDLVLSLVAFGPATAWQLHCQWFESQAHGEQQRMLTDDKPLDEDRLNNQSAMIVMRRTLTDMGHGTEADRAEAARRGIKVRPGEVGSADYGGFRPNVTIAHLTPGHLRFAYTTAMMLLALGIAVYCRRPGRRLSPGQWATEIALVILSTLWFSPLVWSYHLTAALPASAVIFARAPEHPRLAQATAILWLVSVMLMASSLARALGVTLWMNLLLGMILVLTARGDSPSLNPEPSSFVG